MAGVSGGGTNSDMQQSVRRAQGDQDNQRDPVENVLPWVALGIAGIVLLLAVIF